MQNIKLSSLVFIILTIACSTAFTQLQTPEERLKRLIYDEEYFQNSLENAKEKAKKDDYWKKWIKNRKIDLEGARTAVDCEQHYLREEKLDVKFDKTLDSCEEYDVNMSEEYPEYTKAYEMAMRNYYIKALFAVKEFSKAEKEIKKFDNSVNEFKIKKLEDIHENLLIALDYRIQVIDELIKYLSTQNKPEDVIKWTEKNKAYAATLAPIKTAMIEKNEKDKLGLAEWAKKKKIEQEAYDKAADERKVIEQAEKEKQAAIQAAKDDELNKEINKKYEKEIKAATRGRFDFQVDSTNSSGGSCTCTEREQYWVMGRSGSGLVQARPGRWEYREKKIPCPCQ